MGTIGGSKPATLLVHPALFYAGPADYARSVISFLEEGLSAGEPALVAIAGPSAALVRSGLDGAGDKVAFTDLSVLSRNPSRIIPAIQQFANSHPGSQTRFVSQPIRADRTPAEICEAVRHESLVNTAFADAPITILCPYDTTALDAQALHDAELTHPQILQNGQSWLSAAYTGAATALAIGEQRLNPAPSGVQAVEYGAGDLPALRRLVERQATQAGLSDDRAMDLVIAVNEAASNTVIHARARGTLRIWAERSMLICEISDPGRVMDPLAGRRLAARNLTGGQGLRVINQVCDLVELRSGTWGTAIRMHMRCE